MLGCRLSRLNVSGARFCVDFLSNTHPMASGLEMKQVNLVMHIFTDPLSMVHCSGEILYTKG